VLARDRLNQEGVYDRSSISRYRSSIEAMTTEWMLIPDKLFSAGGKIKGLR
jgi:hypothetical protein